MKSGTAAVTLQDIARRVGVSKMTVSAILNGRNTGVAFSEGTRQRVVEAAQALGYRPNRTARALATGRTHTVALWMRYLHPPYFARAMHYLRQEAMHNHYEMIISGMKGAQEGEPGHPEFSDSAVDGILAYEGPEFVNRYLDSGLLSPPPVVNLGAYVTQHTDFVGLDLYPGALAAVNHLLTIRPSSRHRIAYLVSKWGNHAGDARTDAYCAAMQQADRQTEVIPTPDSTRAGSRQVLKSYIAENGCPDALFCFCDDMALGAYRACYEMGYRVPDDIALIGCDGIEETEYLEKQISTIVMPVDEMCALAWKFLEWRMREPDRAHQQAILIPTLSLRESSIP